MEVYAGASVCLEGAAHAKVKKAYLHRALTAGRDVGSQRSEAERTREEREQPTVPFSRRVRDFEGTEGTERRGAEPEGMEGTGF